MKNWPTVSLIIPAFKAEERISACLRSILSQDYPRDKLEIIIADVGTDKTALVANRFAKEVKIKLVDNSKKWNPESGKFIGFNKASGEFYTCLDDDMYFTSKTVLKKVIKPLVEDPTLAASFIGYFVRKSDPPINRFLSYDYLQRDPLYEFLTPSLKKAIVSRGKDYHLCVFNYQNLPTAGGTAFYRKKLMLPIIKTKESYFDIDMPLELIDKGYDRFAYIYQVGYYHSHTKSLSHLLKKRLRNVDNQGGNGYLPNYKNRKYRWLNFDDPKDWFRLVCWVIWANLLIPETIRGLLRAIKHKDTAFWYQPLVSLLVTDVVLWGFLKNPIWWQIVGDLLKQPKNEK